MENEKLIEILKFKDAVEFIAQNYDPDNTVVKYTIEEKKTMAAMNILRQMEDIREGGPNTWVSGIVISVCTPFADDIWDDNDKEHKSKEVKKIAVLWDKEVDDLMMTKWMTENDKVKEKLQKMLGDEV